MLTATLIAAVFITAVSATVCAVNLRRYRPPPAADPANLTFVSICIPARNEAANIEACVTGLLAQAHPAIEVLIYDDQSEDATPAIVRRLCALDPRVRSVRTEALPPGWNGKQWGCERLGRAAEGAWLLFTDADVRFEPDCVGRALAEAEGSEVAFLSTFPRQETGSLGEALLVPLIHFILLSYLPIGRMRATLDPATSAGCGQFLLVRSDAWRAVGGHGAFRGSMHDGIKLPRVLRRAGFRTDLFDGTALLRCRMYDGFAATWRGFAKNAYEGLGSPILLLLFTVLHLVGHVAPWIVLAWAAAAGATALQVTLAGVAILFALGERALLAARFRQSWLSVFLHPAGIAFMTAVQWWSAVLEATGRRAWKGRVATQIG